MKFSKIELEHLFKAWIIISVSFAIVNSGGFYMLRDFNYLLFMLMFVLSSVTIGIGFLLHEIGHKLLAQRYGCIAEFRYNLRMLYTALIISFFQILYVAPGAVIIHGHLTKEKNGKISLAGPMANVVLSLVFLVLYFAFPIEILRFVFSYGFQINTWIALFNMIPFMNFDGLKIMQWNKTVYFGTVGMLVVFLGINALVL
ncbi:MAG: hypothetical protein KKF44_04820 [Nanoarchaeota archaeon]|nr:hypothetical protein [Nanoarchaeota archaeon]